jgi:hypothetical protein
MLVSTIRDWLYQRRATSCVSKKRASVRLNLDELEERCCPAVFNIAAGDVAGLIAAITTSNTNNQADTINLAAGATYSISTVNNSALGDGGLPVVALDGSAANSLTINGNGAIVQRSPVGSTPNFRVFQVTGVLNLDSVTVRNGNSNDANFGAGIDVGAGGSLTLTNSAVLDNVNQTQPGGGIGIEPTAGNVTIINSTISGNFTAAGPGNGNGAGIETFNAGTLLIIQSTIANNQARGNGGGLRAAGTSTVIVRNSILAGNLDNSTIANDLSNGATVTASTSIIQNSSGVPVAGTFSTANPLLGTLKNNGGRTVTHALLAGSPAIDAGSNINAPGPTDQRGPGFNRIINGAVDIGAYEFQQPAVASAVTPNANPSRVGQTVTFTATVAGAAANSNVPQGSVTFYVNGIAAATAGLSNGAASVSFASLAAGSNSIVVVFNPTATGDYTFGAGMSNAFTQLVTAPAATPVVFTAPVSRRWRR